MNNLCDSAVRAVDVVIACAGPSGLACAQILADAGVSVLLVERNAEPGGLARSFDLDGTIFDLGNHKLAVTGAGVHANGAAGNFAQMPEARPSADISETLL